MKHKVPSGKVYEIRQLNALVLANLMKGFPALAPKENGSTNVVTLDDLVGFAEHQRAIIMKGTISPKVTEADYEEMDGPDADSLSAAISRTSKISGAEVADASAFPPEHGNGADGGRPGAEVRGVAVGASPAEPAFSGL